MAYEPPPPSMPYEPFLLGVGVVFDLLTTALIFFSLLFCGFPCFFPFQGIPSFFVRFSLLSQGSWGFGNGKKSLLFWWFSFLFLKKQGKEDQGTARLFIILLVRNFWRVCSQFWLSARNSVSGTFNGKPRGNPSLCWLGGGGVKRHKNCEQTFCEQTGVSYQPKNR